MSGLTSSRACATVLLTALFLSGQISSANSESSKKDDSVPPSVIAAWIVGSVVTLALCIGVPICIYFCCIQSHEHNPRAMNPGAGAYLGTGVEPAMYQPVTQPQSIAPVLPESQSIV